MREYINSIHRSKDSWFLQEKWPMKTYQKSLLDSGKKGALKLVDPDQFKGKRKEEINAQMKRETRIKLRIYDFPAEVQPKLNSSRRGSTVEMISSTPRVLRKSGPNRL